MLPGDQDKAFKDFYDSARYNKILEPKTTLMIHLASAMALSCYPWMQHYLGVAKDMGISQEEIGAVQAVVMAVSAGKVKAQLREVRSKAKARVDVTTHPVTPITWGSTGLTGPIKNQLRR